MKGIVSDKSNEACGFGEDLVSYLYGELNQTELEKMETHLSECEPCVNEFAELSFARLDVYEWHRDEFAQMATPEISIPYEASGLIGNWLGSVRSFFGSAGWWSVPAAGFATVVILFAGWFFTSAPVDVAETDARPAKPNQRDAPPVPTPEIEQVRSENVLPKAQSVSTNRSTERPKASRAVPAPVRPLQPVTAERRQSKPSAARPGTAPRLNDFDDEEDNTLRLGDLLAEIDTRE